MLAATVFIPTDIVYDKNFMRLINVLRVIRLKKV